MNAKNLSILPFLFALACGGEEIDREEETESRGENVEIITTGEDSESSGSSGEWPPPIPPPENICIETDVDAIELCGQSCTAFIPGFGGDEKQEIPEVKCLDENLTCVQKASHTGVCVVTCTPNPDPNIAYPATTDAGDCEDKSKTCVEIFWDFNVCTLIPG